jgi:hypothetical protein
MFRRIITSSGMPKPSRRPASSARMRADSSESAWANWCQSVSRVRWCVRRAWVSSACTSGSSRSWPSRASRCQRSSSAWTSSRQVLRQHRTVRPTARASTSWPRSRTSRPRSRVQASHRSSSSRTAGAARLDRCAGGVAAGVRTGRLLRVAILPTPLHRRHGTTRFTPGATPTGRTSTVADRATFRDTRTNLEAIRRGD